VGTLASAAQGVRQQRDGLGGMSGGAGVLAVTRSGATTVWGLRRRWDPEHRQRREFGDCAMAVGSGAPAARGARVAADRPRVAVDHP
jgi:hypothetical protein